MSRYTLEELVQSEEYQVVLRAFPRIAHAIELVWGQPECDSYCDKLLVSDREYRQGFPRDVLLALRKLQDNHTPFDPDVHGAVDWSVR